ncbi:hypothetical protein H6G00_13570 [Leptolyngbya sp. FACHB-541]|uniref:hypothetical protein n=1 Tax=Leptolyngbya sp. FACHB-541 TaxID=2692810 RepID=UPI0016842F45|nr:hypothetical protein [Leptolyngbya sp. FACHB-541]MBD1997644.1 hypothetical protein [Leptolyngbya sp. FACHB-541]
MTWQEYQNVELVSHQSPNGKRPKFGAKLSSLWRTMLAHLKVSSEPQVWQTRNTAGEIVWNAYNPATGQSLDQVSEQEVRAWLEERHYQYSLTARKNLQQLKMQQLCQMP